MESLSDLQSKIEPGGDAPSAGEPITPLDVIESQLDAAQASIDAARVTLRMMREQVAAGRRRSREQPPATPERTPPATFGRRAREA
jgi:hypothetical protein